MLKEKINPDDYEVEERPIPNSIKRVTQVTKGGRNIGFNVLSVVGNREGIVGLGFGSANDIALSISKSIADAKKNLVRIPLVDGTIPHEIMAEFKAAKVLLKPASAGTGVIAGLATKIILEFAGVQDALTKRLGSRNVRNIAEATMLGLRSLKDINEVAHLRGKTVEELIT